MGALLGAADPSQLRGPAGVFAVILLEFALGSLAILWVTPVWGVVKRGFFLLVASSVVTGAIVAQLSARGPLSRIDGSGKATAALTTFTALSALFLAALLLSKLPLARWLGMAAVVPGVWAALELAALRGTTFRGSVAILTGAAFLGATWVGMLLGHWYLVDRKLTKDPMRAYAWAFTVGIALGVVSAALAPGGRVTTSEAGLNPLLLTTNLTLYLAVGLVAVNALLSFFVHKLVAEGSIRAATGMLYLAVILSFSAEFAAKARFFSV